jgi:hypothetical protein
MNLAQTILSSQPITNQLASKATPNLILSKETNINDVSFLTGGVDYTYGVVSPFPQAFEVFGLRSLDNLGYLTINEFKLSVSIDWVQVGEFGFDDPTSGDMTWGIHFSAGFFDSNLANDNANGNRLGDPYYTPVLTKKVGDLYWFKGTQTFRFTPTSFILNLFETEEIYNNILNREGRVSQENLERLQRGGIFSYGVFYNQDDGDFLTNAVISNAGLKILSSLTFSYRGMTISLT